ncbi:MAG: Lrp/AsnC family transcriptional regulator [Ignavibacteriales bacterium]
MNLVSKLLRLLERNGRQTSQQLAAMLGEDEAKIQQEMARLEKEKVILGYNTVINWDKVKDEGVTAMIDVKVAPERERGFDSIAERIYRFPEVKCVYLMSGTYDLSLLVEGQDLKEIAAFVSQKLSTLAQIQSTTTHFILKRYKQDGFIFEDHEEDRRLMISP